tara:strand:+ start:2878 stop:3264 length:387 start_codon:yes stop_codon:yes gene_type:complete
LKKPVHEDDVPGRVWYKGTDRELTGRALSDVGSDAKIGFGILELAAGSNTGPAHYHSHEEEHLYVLDGNATLHLGSQTFALKKGSYVCFPAGQEIFHHLENNTDSAFRYIIIGERIEDDRVTHLRKDL